MRKIIKLSRLCQPGWKLRISALCCTPRSLITLASVFAYLALGFVITPPFAGDSAFYTMDVLHVRSGTAPPEQLWEFGHLVWRPFVYSLTTFVLSVVPDSIASTAAMKLYVGAEAVSALCGIGCILLMASLLYEVSRKHTGIAFTLTFLILGDAFLSYSYSATPYIPALLLMSFALWLPLHIENSAARIAAATFSLVLMVALWFPFVLAAPAIAISPLALRCDYKSWRESLWCWSYWALLLSFHLVWALVSADAPIPPIP